jgi:hypothetical protein
MNMSLSISLSFEIQNTSLGGLGKFKCNININILLDARGEECQYRGAEIFQSYAVCWHHSIGNADTCQHQRIHTDLYFPLLHDSILRDM